MLEFLLFCQPYAELIFLFGLALPLVGYVMAFKHGDVAMFLYFLGFCFLVFGGILYDGKILKEVAGNTDIQTLKKHIKDAPVAADALGVKVVKNKDFGEAINLGLLPLNSKTDAEALEVYLITTPSNSTLPYNVLTQAYRNGLSDMAKDLTKSQFYQSKVDEINTNAQNNEIEHAKNGDIDLIVKYAEILQTNGALEKALNQTQQTCDNAQKAYSTKLVGAKSWANGFSKEKCIVLYNGNK